MRRLAVLLIVIATVAGGCARAGEETASTTEAGTSTAPPTAAAVSTTATPATSTTGAQDGSAAAPGLPRAVPAFADFVAVPMVADEPPYAGPATPHSLDGIYIPVSVQRNLDDRAASALEQLGFVVVPGRSNLFHPMYQESVYEGEVHFVTTDAAYHYLHLAFSKVLRDLEQDELLPVLEQLVTGLVTAARSQRDELQGTPLADTADRVAQLYEAAATLLGVDVGPIGDLAAQEVALATNAAEFVRSPITGLGPTDPFVSAAGLVDYSLFRPRGHYTRNADLERYFRAMSLLGNENFDVARKDTMLMAALATRVLVTDPARVDAWRLLYEPTAFLVGMADDYTPLELAAQLDGLAPGWRDDATQLDLDVAGAAGAGLLAFRSVGIDPDASSVRIMGARFVVDSYIYDQLRGPYVGDGEFGRIMAQPMDLVAAFGSELAYRLQDAAGETAYRNYDEQLATLQEMLGARTPEDWAATVYDAWLYALEPVWQPLGEAYPDFMQSAAWEVKDLQTGLGSYVELKHDTVLYAKQSFAPEGDYEPPPEYPEPRHWVEPNPVAFERMDAVLGLLEAGLDRRGLLPADSGNARLIDALDGFLQRLARIARDELGGRPISAADNEWLQFIGSAMEALWVQSSDSVDEAGDFPDQDVHAAVIADIMRSTTTILEIGTGYVDALYVLVPDDEGRFQIAKGAVYSYYEFMRDAADGRLTDEEWWATLASNSPERPSWETPVFPGASRYDVGLAAGETCWTLADATSYTGIVAYYLAYGRPWELDWEQNGVPCDEAPPVFDASFYAGIPEEPGLLCRDLLADGYGFAEAVAYWLEQRQPERMDADANGIPCETVYSASEIEEFFTGN